MRLILVMLCTILVASCTTETITQPAAEAYVLGKLNVVAINNEPVSLSQTDQFAWQGDLVFSGDVKPGHAEKIKPQIKAAISSHFASQGLGFNANITDADYLLVGLVLLEGHEKDPKHADLLFGLDPGMRSQGDYGLGTLLVGIKSAKSGNYVWRGAVQILTSPNNELPEDIRSARLENAIDALFKGFLSQRVVM